MAVLLREAFDERIPAEDDGGLVWIGALILALYLGSAAVGLLTRYSVLRVTKAAVTRLRTQLLERLYVLPQTFFDRSSHGRLHSVVVQDSERLDVMANALIAQLVPSLVVSVGLLLTLLSSTLCSSRSCSGSFRSCSGSGVGSEASSGGARNAGSRSSTRSRPRRN